MRTNKSWLPLWLPCLLSLAYLSSACTTIQDATECASAGDVSNGAICTHLISTATGTLTFHEYLDFLDAQAKRTCVVVPGYPVCADDQTSGTPSVLPARGAAIAMSSGDWGTMKTELETLCREMGSRCSLAVQGLVRIMDTASKHKTPSQ